MISIGTLAIIISLVALLISVVGWIIVHRLNIDAANIDRKNNFQLHIYQNLLDRSNELIKIISNYTTSSMSHTNVMAKMLNEYHSLKNAPDSSDKIDTIYSLKMKWLEEAHKLSELSFEMQEMIEDYMRYLDMNGTDYTKGTTVYDSLLTIKMDAYKAADRNRARWNDHEKMDKLTPKSYEKLLNDTKTDTDIIFDFGMCIDDVLSLIYNQSISSVLKKPLKRNELSEKRRIITAKGIVDNRE